MLSGAAAIRSLAFEPLYHGDRLHVVNPRGDVGLITLWSPARSVRRKLEELAPELLDPARSRVAVMANLYGDGMLAMFCNLLHNPQVRHLVAVGEDLGLPVPREIEAFLKRGLEDATLLGRPVKRVAGTGRVFPAVAGFDEERLRRTLSFRHFGRLSGPELAELPAYVDGLPEGDAREDDRLRVDIPAPADDEHAFRPSDVHAHQVVRARPLDCWEELVVRTMRFGRPVELAKGRRIELLDAKAVIAEPAEEPAEALAAHGFDRDRLRAYQQAILAPERPDGVAYTYGNRLRGGGHDALAAAVDLLRADPETRNAYVSLWDTPADMAGGSVPCLTTVFLRRSEGRLALTATFRSHNLLDGWLLNAYGLMAIQRHVAEPAGMEPGPITVVSHSLTVDPASSRFALAEAVAEGWTSDDDADREAGKRTLREDPHGYFVVSADPDRGLIVAEHRYGGVLVKRYEAERAVTIERAVAADMAVSLVSHALWLGRELNRTEQLLARSRG